VSTEDRLIRVLDGPEIERLVGWAALVGWNPGPFDAQAFATIDPAGWIGAFVGGEMVAGIAALAYDERFGFIGLYICDPVWRGLGHGRAVWDAGMAHLGDRTIGLDGVSAQQANYRSMGFAAQYRTIRFSGRAERIALTPGEIQAVTPDLFDAVTAFDRRCFPADRQPFLKRWLAPPLVVRVATSGGTITGCGVRRACGEGSKIGPLFATDDAVALRLLADLAATDPGDLYIDVPKARSDFIDVLREAGFLPGFETARMYRGAPPTIEQHMLFGVTTLELG
jgi:hypothetical protein